MKITIKISVACHQNAIFPKFLVIKIALFKNRMSSEKFSIASAECRDSPIVLYKIIKLCLWESTLNVHNWPLCLRLKYGSFSIRIGRLPAKQVKTNKAAETKNVING